MKIDNSLPKTDLNVARNDRLEQAQAPEREKQNVQETAARSSQSRDTLRISSLAEQLKTVAAEGIESPAVREDKVAAISKQMDEGTYQAKSTDVAQKMISSMRNGLG